MKMRGLVVVLAALAVACMALLGTFGRSQELMGGGGSSEHATLVAQLQSLLKTLTPIGHPQAEAKGKAGGGKGGGPRDSSSQWSATQLERNACKDGEPCHAGRSNMPELKYNPESGNWDMISAGNPTAVWHSLMSEARKRDKSRFGREQQANLLAEENRKLNEAKGQPQMLLEVDDGGNAGKHQQLEDELRGLLQDKVAHFSQEESGSDKEGGADMEDPTTAFAYGLASHLKRAGEYLEGSGKDAAEYERLASRLSHMDKVKDVCRHPRLATEALGVFAHSSMSGCERQVKITVHDLASKLRSRASALRSRPMGLEGSKASLTSQLRTLKRSHWELEDELSSQEQRIRSLSRGRASPPAPPGLPPGYDTAH